MFFCGHRRGRGGGGNKHNGRQEENVVPFFVTTFSKHKSSGSNLVQINVFLVSECVCYRVAA